MFHREFRQVDDPHRTEFVNTGAVFAWRNALDKLLDAAVWVTFYGPEDGEAASPLDCIGCLRNASARISSPAQ